MSMEKTRCSFHTDEIEYFETVGNFMKDLKRYAQGVCLSTKFRLMGIARQDREEENIDGQDANRQNDPTQRNGMP